ncbi:unnamed protein product [Closterium sp. NIES-54]
MHTTCIYIPPACTYQLLNRIIHLPQPLIPLLLQPPRLPPPPLHPSPHVPHSPRTLLHLPPLRLLSRLQGMPHHHLHHALVHCCHHPTQPYHPRAAERRHAEGGTAGAADGVTGAPAGETGGLKAPPGAAAGAAAGCFGAAAPAGVDF